MLVPPQDSNRTGHAAGQAFRHHMTYLYRCHLGTTAGQVLTDFTHPTPRASPIGDIRQISL